MDMVSLECRPKRRIDGAQMPSAADKRSSRASWTEAVLLRLVRPAHIAQERRTPPEAGQGAEAKTLGLWWCFREENTQRKSCDSISKCGVNFVQKAFHKFPTTGKNYRQF